tara:strand:- start:19474 stop:19875 length:402 start_codon:yes stop_codon:yes gene_type:complete
VITLKSVTNSDIRFLFDLLENRDPIANISHKKMPSYAQHTRFVKSKPYLKWYIILKDKEKIGSIYLSKNNEIGLSILKSEKINNIQKIALNELIKKNPRKRFLANINPKNKNLISFFKKNDFKLIQYTFEKIK